MFFVVLFCFNLQEMEGRGERIQSETNNKRKREKEEEQKAQNTVNESGMEERTDKR